MRALAASLFVLAGSIFTISAAEGPANDAGDFVKTCVESAPDFAKLPELAANLGMTRDDDYPNQSLFSFVKTKRATAWSVPFRAKGQTQIAFANGEFLGDDGASCWMINARVRAEDYAQALAGRIAEGRFLEARDKSAYPSDILAMTYRSWLVPCVDRRCLLVIGGEIHPQTDFAASPVFATIVSGASVDSLVRPDPANK